MTRGFLAIRFTLRVLCFARKAKRFGTFAMGRAATSFAKVKNWL